MIFDKLPQSLDELGNWNEYRTYTVTSAYNNLNLRTGITYPDSVAVAREYTSRDQLYRVKYNGG